MCWKCADLCVLSSQEECSWNPQVYRAEKRWGCSLAVDALPFSYFHHSILQPLERREDFREGNALQLLNIEVYRVYLLFITSVWSLFLSSTPGSVGDRHLALHSAFYPVNSRRHSARSLERCGVLPKTPVGEAAGDQCELNKVGQSACWSEKGHNSLIKKNVLIPYIFCALRIKFCIVYLNDPYHSLINFYN